MSEETIEIQHIRELLGKKSKEEIIEMMIKLALAFGEIQEVVERNVIDIS